jgi:P27 family predicted phage terminase small subunit
MSNKPVPTALRMLRGNPGRRPLPPYDPHPPRGLPDPPADLDGAALAEWQRLGPLLEAQGLMTVLDAPAFATYCRAWGRYLAALAALEQEGDVLVSPTGYRYMNPHYTMAEKERIICRQFWDAFGMTPSARTKVAMHPERRAPEPRLKDLA